jgi:hypothetical protein
MKYGDLRDFLRLLEEQGELKRISAEVSPVLEMTEICDRTLKRGGPALLFENPTGHDIPVLGNLFGTPRRVALGMGQDSVESLREVGRLLAMLKEPDPPSGMRDAWEKLPVFRQVMNMAPKAVRSAPCQANVLEGGEVDLGRLPVQTCWPGDAGPLITWGLVVTRGPERPRQNLGIYRQQVKATSTFPLDNTRSASSNAALLSPPLAFSTNDCNSFRSFSACSAFNSGATGAGVAAGCCAFSQVVAAKQARRQRDLGAKISFIHEERELPARGPRLCSQT